MAPPKKGIKNMPLFWNERRGPEWKQGWVGQTMSAASLPPLPLLIVFTILLLFLSLSHHASLKEKMHHNVINFKLVLFVVPAALIFITRSMIYKGKINCTSRTPPRYNSPSWGFGLRRRIVGVVASGDDLLQVFI
ncbi:hypothetical protein Scep_028439 [Stephania cephalantha]|uniref:Transmembrane protein n=1 Tax=Stephania cephalantha TaxID=152367 RepID=A0AAP0EEI9_9MAGN